MKKRIFSLVLVAILCLAVASPAFAAVVTPMQAGGTIAMSNSGRTVSFNGYSTSAQTEDLIRITVILWELRGSTWYEVARTSAEKKNADYVSTSSSKTVTGNYYYKITGIHYSEKGGKSYTVTSESASKWIP